MTRISRLRALIEHPATGAGERAAAQRMLDRILATSGRITSADRSYGARYDRAGRHADLDELAELIRADIAFARVVFAEGAQPGELAVSDPIRDAPAEVTYTVTGLSNENSIVITIDDVPPHWGWGSADTVTPALQALADELAAIMNSYNHEGESIGKRFFARVRAGNVTLVW